MDRHFILSTCGTSILTNGVNAELRTLVNKAANAGEAELSADDKKKLKDHIEERKSTVLALSPNEAKRASAELNGILSFYGNQLDNRGQDMHYLVVTDTFLGSQVGAIVRKWLEEQGLKVQIKKFDGLVANDLDKFRSAASNLIKWCEEILPGYQADGYKVIFNLTGGFKSIQGFMQTIGMFYADENIYIFETGSLLRIPKLPVKLDTDHVIDKNQKAFRRLGAGENLSVAEAEGIPDVLLFEVDGYVTLSEWGELVWQRGKYALYESDLLDPLPPLVYSDTFCKSVTKMGLTSDRLAVLNERLDQLSLVVRKKGANLQSLDFKALKGDPRPPSTHECDVWTGEEYRLFGHFEDGAFVIDDIARGLHK